MHENTNAEIKPKPPQYKGWAFGAIGKPNVNNYNNSRSLWFYSDGLSTSKPTRSQSDMLQDLVSQGYTYYLN